MLLLLFLFHRLKFTLFHSPQRPSNNQKKCRKKLSPQTRIEQNCCCCYFFPVCCVQLSQIFFIRWGEWTSAYSNEQEMKGREGRSRVGSCPSSSDLYFHALCRWHWYTHSPKWDRLILSPASTCPITFETHTNKLPSERQNVWFQSVMNVSSFIAMGQPFHFLSLDLPCSNSTTKNDNVSAILFICLLTPKRNCDARCVCEWFRIEIL